MTVFWMLVIVILTVFAAGLYTNRQTYEAELDQESDLGAQTTPDQTSPGVAGAIAGFGLFAGWVVVGGVTLYRAKRAKGRLAAETSDLQGLQTARSVSRRTRR